jgi:broad specificity phosphatase PhoE
MRHAEVSYVGAGGEPVDPELVPLNEEGHAQAAAAARALADISFDRVLTSGLARTIETAEIVAPAHALEHWAELQELRGGRLADIPSELLEQEFVHAFRGVIPNDARFLRGESIGELFDRVLPALDRLVEDSSWDTALAVLHGGVNRAILSFALTGGRTYLGPLEQGPACINILDLGEGGDWIVRAVNVSPYDALHVAHRRTTMERYWDELRPYLERHR